jgi:dihydrolipoamide dehydrogenase
MVIGESTHEADLLIIGGGPGGYHAAFRAAENGIRATLVDLMPQLGGVCLHRGCIPSKTYLSMVDMLHQAALGESMGIRFARPTLDVDRIRSWRTSVVNKLADGLDARCKKHKVRKIQGKARFEDDRTVVLEGTDLSRIRFRKAIIATGSRSIRLPGVQIGSPNVWTSREALELEGIPESLLVIGGGYIGLELGQVYAGFGSKVTVVEMLPGLLPGADRDLVRPLLRRLDEEFEEVCVETQVVAMKEMAGGIELEFEGKNPPKNRRFAKVLVSVGRYPNSRELDPQKAGVDVDGKGFVKVDEGFQTSCPDIYAIGDVIGNPMLAHKALHEGRAVADRIAGKDVVFKPRAIPAVVFTDPEVAWTGHTQEEAKAAGLDFVVKKIPFGACGRAATIGRSDGLAKLLFDKSTHRLLGMGLTGPHVGEMIAEGALAMEMNATARDLASTVHPHPTISEMIGEAAAMLV